MRDDLGNMTAESLAHLSKGSYAKALEILEHNEERMAQHEQFTTIMRMSYVRNMDAVLKWSDEMGAMGREQQKFFLKYGSEYLRENFMNNFRQPEIVYINEDEKAFSEKFSPFINERNVLILFEEFEKAYRDITRNGNAKIIFTDLSLKIMKYIRA